MSKKKDKSIDAQYEDIIKNEEQGSVNMDRFAPPKAQSADIHLGYHDMNVEDLPSGGVFYQDSMKISIRSATVMEVRHFSTIDEQNLLDVDEKMNYILKSCTRISGVKGKTLSYKDLCEEDRFFVILSIRDLTFPEPESALTLEHRDSKGKTHNINIDKKYFQYFNIPTELEKYYSDEAKTFSVETKSFGTINMKPPSIGVMEQMTAYIKTQRDEGIDIDTSILQIMPYLVGEWRGFNKKKIFEFEIEMNGWSSKKYSLMFKLAEKMRIGVQPNMLVNLNGEEDVEIPINFRDGIKSLFIIQDIAGELL